MDIYEQAEANQRAINFNRSRPTKFSDFSDAEMKRVRTVAQKTSYSEEDVMREAINSELFYRANILPEPGRQGIHEVALNNYVVSNVPILQNSDMLPKSGPRSRWLHHGVIVSTKPKNDTKSLDLYATINKGGETVDVYGICKYTKQGGGAQDNQFNDVVATLEHAKADTSALIIAILDGPYYENAGKSGINKKNMLKQRYADLPNVIITDHENLTSELTRWANR